MVLRDFIGCRFLSRTGQLRALISNFLTLRCRLPITLSKENCAMIELTRLNGTPMVVNSDLIKTAEAAPDTMLTLITGEKMIVREKLSVVVERIITYRARLLADVARRLPNFSGVERIAACASLDVGGQRTPPNQK
jgi:uncharacterized protein YlzI (FlbEa/FlbD family)